MKNNVVSFTDYKNKKEKKAPIIIPANDIRYDWGTYLNSIDDILFMSDKGKTDDL